MTSSSSTQPRQFLPVEFLLDSSSLRPPLASSSTPLGIPRPPLLFPSAPSPYLAARPPQSLAGVPPVRHRAPSFLAATVSKAPPFPGRSSCLDLVRLTDIFREFFSQPSLDSELDRRPPPPRTSPATRPRRTSTSPSTTPPPSAPPRHTAPRRRLLHLRGPPERRGAPRPSHPPPSPWLW